jgi:ABC-type uncharacterized transport system substrate-binding protein
MNRRRNLLVALGAAALAGPLSTFAQQQDKVWRVGYLSMASRPVSLDSYTFGAFSQGMRELGYIEGKNLEIEWRFAHSQSELLPGLLAELVRLKVDVIVAGNSTVTQAAQKATTTIPIVMGTSGDPVKSGFVKSLAHPGGNITGLSTVHGEVATKHLEMLHAIVPKLSRVAVLVNPIQPTHATILKSIQVAAEKMGIKVLPVEARTAQEIENAFSVMTPNSAGAIIVLGDIMFYQHVRQIAQLAAKHRLSSIAAIREYADAGGLMSYGASITDSFRRAATFVDKIFKGAKPADLPVEQPTKFELFINGKTAKALGLKIPQSLLISADKVID